MVYFKRINGRKGINKQLNDDSTIKKITFYTLSYIIRFLSLITSKTISSIFLITL